MMTNQKPKKEKRAIPLRTSGEMVNSQSTRPSQFLFGEVKRLEDLETQAEKAGNPKDLHLETQKEEVGNPNTKTLDTQTFEFGNPKLDKLGTKVPKTEIWAPKNDKELGANVPEENKLGTQEEQKTKNFRKYEKARSTVSMHIRADAEIVKKVKHFIVENEKDIPNMKEFFELSAMKFMEEFGNPTFSGLGTNAPYDDRRLKMMFKSRSFIIDLYLAYNSAFNQICSETNGTKGKWSARWSPRDDEAGRRYNELSPMIVELGIIQTQINKGFGNNRIQTFKYYIDEIENVLASGVSDEMLATVLEYHRQMWKQQSGKTIDYSKFESTE